MKHLNYVFVILLCFLIQDAYSQSHWTFYNDTHHKGYHQKFGSGEARVTSQWKWDSWKSDCCITFYYYTRRGKIQKKTLCGDVRDFKAELKKWGDLKYGYRNGWKNIQKIYKFCDEKYASKNEGHYDNNRDNHNNNRNRGKYNNRSNRNDRNDHNNNRNNYNNHNDRNDHNNNRNNNNDRNDKNKYDNKKNYKGNNNYNAKNDYSKYKWYKYYGKGNVIFTSDYHYEGQYKARASGSHDSRSLRVSPRSVVVSKSGRYLIVEYRDHRNRRQSFKLREDVPDLNKYMSSDLRLGDKHKDEPYKAITKFTIMRY